MRPNISYKKYCGHFAALLIALNVCTFYLKFFCIFREIYFCMQIELKLSSLEIVSALENKELLSHIRVYRKSNKGAM